MISFPHSCIDGPTKLTNNLSGSFPILSLSLFHMYSQINQKRNHGRGGSWGPREFQYAVQESGRSLESPLAITRNIDKIKFLWQFRVNIFTSICFVRNLPGVTSDLKVPMRCWVDDHWRRWKMPHNIILFIPPWELDLFCYNIHIYVWKLSNIRRGIFMKCLSCFASFQFHLICY